LANATKIEYLSGVSILLQEQDTLIDNSLRQSLFENTDKILVNKCCVPIITEVLKLTAAQVH
jgi:hypothetical protein